MKKQLHVNSGKSAGVAGPASGHPEVSRKYGADHNETMTHLRKHHANFKQSADIREDRCIRQSKTRRKGG